MEIGIGHIRRSQGRGQQATRKKGLSRRRAVECPDRFGPVSIFDVRQFGRDFIQSLIPGYLLPMTSSLGAGSFKRIFDTVGMVGELSVIDSLDADVAPAGRMIGIGFYTSDTVSLNLNQNPAFGMATLANGSDLMFFHLCTNIQNVGWMPVNPNQSGASLPVSSNLSAISFNPRDSSPLLVCQLVLISQLNNW